MRAAAPNVRGRVRGEGALAVPDHADRLVDQERECRRAERIGGGELPFPSTAGPGEKPERERRNRDDWDCPRFKCVELAPEPGVVIDELIYRVVDAVVDGHGQGTR